MTSRASASVGEESSVPRLVPAAGAPSKRDYELDATQWALFSALLAAPSREDVRLRALLSAPSVDATPLPLLSAGAVGRFSCGHAVLDEALRRDASAAAAPVDAFACRAFAILREGRVVAYYAQRRCCVRRMTRPADSDDDALSTPILLLQRLAVDGATQGRGLGTALLRDALLRALTVGERYGARALCVHALSRDVKRFYLERGFRPMPGVIDPLGVMLTFDALRKAAAN
jgi:GNAT superfamily N-acetyltransferase